MMTRKMHERDRKEARIRGLVARFARGILQHIDDSRYSTSDYMSVKRTRTASDDRTLCPDYSPSTRCVHLTGNMFMSAQLW
jgi:hypothetical protein